MKHSYKKVIYDGHELLIPARFFKESFGDRIMRVLLNPNDWLAQHQRLCIIGIVLCICLVGAL